VVVVVLVGTYAESKVLCRTRNCLDGQLTASGGLR